MPFLCCSIKPVYGAQHPPMQQKMPRYVDFSDNVLSIIIIVIRFLHADKMLHSNKNGTYLLCFVL